MWSSSNRYEDPYNVPRKKKENNFNNSEFENASENMNAETSKTYQKMLQNNALKQQEEKEKQWLKQERRRRKEQMQRNKEIQAYYNWLSFKSVNPREALRQEQLQIEKQRRKEERLREEEEERLQEEEEERERQRRVSEWEAEQWKKLKGAIGWSGGRKKTRNNKKSTRKTRRNRKN